MGLSIVHKIVEAHDGTIEVASTPGESTVFKLRSRLWRRRGPGREETFPGPQPPFPKLLTLLNPYPRFPDFYEVHNVTEGGREGLLGLCVLD
ncbi:MAG: hypothetical protein ACLR7Z_18435 [Bilophila wadsworthia]